jgi:hypothetical protein
MAPVVIALLTALLAILAAATVHRLRRRARPPAAPLAALPPAPESAQPVQLARRVFISHTGSDEGAKVFAVSVLKQALDNAGLDTFIDIHDLPPGCDWPGELADAAAHSAVFVAVLVRRRGGESGHGLVGRSKGSGEGEKPQGGHKARAKCCTEPHRTAPSPTRSTPPIPQSKSYTSRFWCMLELDLALHGLPGQPRAAEPLVIPVFYDSPDGVVQPAGIERHWQARLDAKPAAEDAVPANRRKWVRPDRWAQNVTDTKERLQNVRRSTEGAAKDEELQLARHVVATALAAARVPLAEPESLVGIEEQEARLLAELAVPDAERLGLWLHGMGGCLQRTHGSCCTPPCCMHVSRLSWRRDGDTHRHRLPPISALHAMQAAVARQPWQRACTTAYRRPLPSVQ